MNILKENPNNQATKIKLRITTLTNTVNKVKMKMVILRRTNINSLHKIIKTS